MTGRGGRWAFGILAALALGAAPGFAQVESKCLSGKLKGVGSSAQGQLGCEAKAAAKGQAVDPECSARHLAKLQKAFEKAENKDDCIGLGDSAIGEALVEDFVQGVLAEMNAPPAICCSLGNACVYAPDATACMAISGSAVPGAAGTVCSGDGACAAPPAVPGACCQDFTSIVGPLDCAHGSGLDQTTCEGYGGTFSSSALCTRSGRCL
jgi:hypothetical protein